MIDAFAADQPGAGSDEDRSAQRSHRLASGLDGNGPVESTETDATGVLASAPLGSEPLKSALRRVADHAKKVLGVTEASVTLVAGKRTITATWTGLVAYERDECQYGLGYGPCLHAAFDGSAVLWENSPTDTRWPRFGELALTRGVHSVLAVPVVVGGIARAALNLYALEPGLVKTPSAASAAVRIAVQAGPAIAHALELQAARNQIEHLQTALQSRTGIEQAKGILMALHGYSADEAFAALAEQSQRTNIKVRDLAAQLVDGVSRPDSSGPSR